MITTSLEFHCSKLSQQIVCCVDALFGSKCRMVCLWMDESLGDVFFPRTVTEAQPASFMEWKKKKNCLLTVVDCIVDFSVVEKKQSEIL
jgi:hypothetical protein